jgi:hypothetical protein
MNIKKTVNLALKDPEFANRMRRMAQKASRDGFRSGADIAFLKLFVRDEEELTRLTTSGSGITGGTPWKDAIAILLNEIKTLREERDVKPAPGRASKKSSKASKGARARK